MSVVDDGTEVPFDERLFEYISSVENSDYLTGTQSNRSNQFKRSYIGNRNPSAVRTVVNPVSSSSTDNDYIPSLLKDPSYYDLMDEMYDRDGVIQGTVDLMIAQICGKGMAIVSGDPSNELANEAREFAEKQILEMKGVFGFRQAARNIVRGSLVHGISILEKVYQKRGDQIVYKGLIHRHPGQFEIDADGTLYFYRDITGSRELKPLSPYKFSFTTTPALYGSPYGESILYPLRWPYYLKKCALNSWADSVEVAGTPIIYGVIGERVSDKRAAEQRLRAAIGNIRRNNGLILPDGVTLDTFERGIKSGTLPHKELIQYFDKVIVRAMMGSTLSSMENEGTGSLSQSVVHNKISEDILVPIIEIFEESIQELVESLHMMNYGDAVPAPKFIVDVEGETSIQDVERSYNIANSIGLEVSKEEAYKNLRLLPPQNEDDKLDLKESLLDSTVGRKPEGSKSKVAANLEIPPAPMSKSGKTVVFMDSDEVARLGKEYDEFLLALSAVLSQEATEEIVESLRTGALNIKRNLDAGALLDASVINQFSIPSNLTPSASQAITSAQGYAASRFIELLEGSFDLPISVNIEDLNPMYREGLEWLNSRGLATVDEVDEMSRALTYFQRDKTEQEISRGLRSQVLALQGAPSKLMAEKYMSLITSSVNQGMTIGEFSAFLDDLIATGQIPPVIQSYMNNVFRTEVSMVYNAQREANIKDPDVVDFVWGKEFFNPQDDRSRDSHSAMDGVRVKLGSPAELATRGGPPWSYQCRCGWVPILGTDEENQETEGAESLAANIERFGSEGVTVKFEKKGIVDKLMSKIKPKEYKKCLFDEYGMHFSRADKEMTVLPRGNGRFDIECEMKGMARVVVDDDGISFISDTLECEVMSDGIHFVGHGPVVIRNYSNSDIYFC